MSYNECPEEYEGYEDHMTDSVVTQFIIDVCKNLESPTREYQDELIAMVELSRQRDRVVEAAQYAVDFNLNLAELEEPLGIVALELRKLRTMEKQP